MRLVARACALALLAACVAASARGGTPERDGAKLRARLAPDVAERVLELVNAARADSLPTDPLVGRALEGASRRASAGEILAEVRRHAAALSAARSALGAGARSAEIEAGAGALLAGVPADSLSRLRSTHRTGSLAISIVVLCDLIARGVPVDAASSTMIAAARAGAADDALLRMRERVHDQIRRGASPTGTVLESLRQLLRTTPAAAEGAGPRRRTP